MKKLALSVLALTLALTGCKPATETTTPAHTEGTATTEATTSGETHETPSTEGSAEATP